MILQRIILLVALCVLAVAIRRAVDDLTSPTRLP